MGVENSSSNTSKSYGDDSDMFEVKDETGNDNKNANDEENTAKRPEFRRQKRTETMLKLKKNTAIKPRERTKYRTLTRPLVMKKK